MASKQRDKDQQGKRNLRPRRSVTVEKNDNNSGGNSLDVLAQVASETLEKEPKPQKNSPRKKISLRNISNVERLTLEQILGLTEKTIMNLFTEVNSNEIARTFTFTCHLIPKECQKQYTSFGSEMRARVDMKKHIYAHLDELEKQESGSRKKFTAEPLPVTRKRLMSNFMPPKRYSTMRNSQKLKFKSGSKTQEQMKQKSSHDSMTVSSPASKQRSSDDAVSDDEIEVKWERDQDPVNAIGFIPVPDKMKTNNVTKDALRMEYQKVVDETSLDSDMENDNLPKEEDQQFIIELLSKTQPHHDHCYTTIFGKRKGVIDGDRDPEDITNADVGIESADCSFTIPGTNRVVFFINNKNNKCRNPTPILFLRHRSPDENVPMVSAEEIIELDEPVEEEPSPVIPNTCTVSSGQKPYPPMPKSKLAKRGRIGFDISDIATEGSEDESEFIKKRKKSNNPMGREGREGNLGWEPKLALKYIRELKGRKKDENIPLKCKICNDKTFTAAATLMYHYRSHAGIKPFVCLICNTTFTRQHSLNYHMLIHNNQSRFTCKDCGRKFRHPSHFKEHLRRHTGETPFECQDCGQKFKTRNTYKRHLKTRHGKLLTASGIHVLTMEEFDKVRTKRYSVLNLPDISYQMPDLVFSKMKEKRTAKKGAPNMLGNKKVAGQGEYVFTEHKPKQLSKDKFTDLGRKTEIKKEVVSSDEDDPELNNILQVLEEQPKEELNFLKTEPVSPSKPFTTGIFVNKKYAEKNSVVLPSS